jgi:hypothetical protein
MNNQAAAKVSGTRYSIEQLDFITGYTICLMGMFGKVNTLIVSRNPWQTLFVI